MPRTILERFEDAAANLAEANSGMPAGFKKPLKKPMPHSRRDIKLIESSPTTLTRLENNRRRTCRDLDGTASFSDDPAIDAGLSDDLAEHFREADLALASMTAHADPLIQDHLTGRVQAFLQELLRLAHQGPGDPDIDFYRQAKAAATAEDVRAAIKAANINTEVPQ